MNNDDWRMPDEFPYRSAGTMEDEIQMLENNHNLDLSARDLQLIQDALFTQEKILSVQSRAGGNAAKTRLNEVQHLMRRVRSNVPQPAKEQRKGLFGLTRALFGRACLKST